MDIREQVSKVVVLERDRGSHRLPWVETRPLSDRLLALPQILPRSRVVHLYRHPSPRKNLLPMTMVALRLVAHIVPSRGKDSKDCSKLQ